VTGYDISADRAAASRRGRSPIDDLQDADIQAMLDTRRYVPTARADMLAGFDVALVTVPTPLFDGRPDVSAVVDAGRTLSTHVRPGVLVVLESTVAPGTTDGIFRSVLEENPASLAVGANGFRVGFSPERIDPGNAEWDFVNTPKLVSGVDAESLVATAAFYSTICTTVVSCLSTSTAEMALSRTRTGMSTSRW
jgi:nucleotide sugar dehydrogenase